MAWLIEVLVPVGAGTEATFETLQRNLTEKFGGVTAYERAPAKGRWRPEGDHRAQSDDIALVEVMADDLDHPWWADLRAWLEAELHQQEIVVRAHQITRM